MCSTALALVSASLAISSLALIVIAVSIFRKLRETL